MKWISTSVLLGGFVLIPLAHAARDLACKPAPEIAERLAELARQWQPRLSTESGYSPVLGVTVCLATSGLPFADQKNMRIYVRPLTSLDAQVTLAHEYLHLAFAHHPNGRNEVYIERMAQELVEQP